MGGEGKRHLANYIGWRVITSHIKHFSQDYRDAFEEYQQRLQGRKTKKQKTAAERCAEDLSAFAYGFFLGLEVTHGFDDEGSSFDMQGLMRTWWSNTAKERYDEKKEGFVNGQLTLGENIADNRGLKAVCRGCFNHFQARVQGDPEPLLLGMTNINAEQFFLFAGQVWSLFGRASDPLY
ncbi:hypothetical protein RvY_02567 [Ramazzottius varieornatus]|uniref:Peptidase M13 C-terminal domain-containing protein n=1 Tax=Ramazzottius varieornatus TaxID=947166 RepID=A0A1D1UVA4_RAMVA|nr:hypothetical protein RvY_02567 [Ramazzottius varieornatus]